MVQDTSWHTEGRIVYTRASGVITMDDIQAFNTHILSMFEQGTAPVHLIVHHDSIERMPANLRALRQALNLMEHPSAGIAVNICTRRSTWSYVAQMLARMAGRPFNVVESLEGALDLLRANDHSLAAILDTEPTHNQHRIS